MKTAEDIIFSLYREKNGNVETVYQNDSVTIGTCLQAMELYAKYKSMKTEIKLDETTLPKDGQHVKWMTDKGIYRSGKYIADEHMFAYAYSPEIVHDWDTAHNVDSWSPVEDTECLECDWTGEQSDLHMVNQVDFKCPECGSQKLEDIAVEGVEVKTNGQAINFDNHPPVI